MPKKKRQPADTYERLRKLILDRCEPGEALSEPKLAKLLHVSRTPIRETLARLERDGLVTIVPRRGAFVRNLGVADIHELFEVREAIETYEIRQVAKHIDLVALEALEQRMDTLYENLDKRQPAAKRFNAMLPVFDELHDLILATRRNKLFVDILRSLSGSWSLGRKKLLSRLGEEAVQRGYEEHKEIIRVLKRQDPAAAERVMRMHLLDSCRRYVSAHKLW